MSTNTPRRRQTVEQADLLREAPLRYSGQPPYGPVSPVEEPTQAMPMVRRAKPSGLANGAGQFIGIGLVVIVCGFLLGALGILAVRLLMWLWGAL